MECKPAEELEGESAQNLKPHFHTADPKVVRGENQGMHLQSGRDTEGTCPN